MPKYKVTVMASYDTVVEADSEDEAEEIARKEAYFECIDYCDIEEIYPT